MWQEVDGDGEADDAFEARDYVSQPGVLAIGRFADGDIAADITTAGGRAMPAATIGEGAERISLVAGVAVVIAAIAADDPSDARDAVLAALQEGAANRRFAVIAIVPAALIDVVAAALDGERIELLVDSDAEDRRSALAHALKPRTAMLHDVGGEAARGGALREEVARIAQRLAAISGAELPILRDRTSGYAGPARREPSDAATIRAIIRARRLREQFFGPELFADPAWDMLLDLMAARLEGEEVAVSSLCIAAAVPPTTALRWIKTLTDAGLLVRRADPLDRRRVFIALGEAAAEAMERYLAALGRSGGAAVV